MGLPRAIEGRAKSQPDGLDVVLVEGDVGDGEVVAVTVEPAGGVETPTSPPVVASDPV